MAKKIKANKSAAVVEEIKEVPPVVETKPSLAETIPVTPVTPIVPAVKTGSYDPVKSKAYRDKIKAAAIAGGHVFKEKGVGTGATVKKVSKTGKEYYYQPWSQLTEEQKKARLEAARVRASEDREMARKYREEHPELFSKKEEVA